NRPLCRADDATSLRSSDATDGADALGEKYHRALFAAVVRNSHPDIFYRFHPRDNSPTALGRRGILVFYSRRSALADCVLRFASTSHYLRLRSRTDACALGLVNGRTGEQISGQRRRRSHRDEPDKFFDRARPLFFPALQRARHRSLRDREFILQRRALRPTPLRDARRYLCLSRYLYLLDDSEEPDRFERSRDIFFPRFYLCDEPAAFERLARDRIAANYLCQFRRRSGGDFAKFLRVGRRITESVYARS